MSDIRARLPEALVELENMSDRLRDTLDASIEAGQAVRRCLEEGTPLTDQLRDAHVAQHRSDITQAMANYEAARRRLRSLCFALAAEEGLSIGAIARLWGVSRQLAQRTIREAAPLIAS